MDGAGRTQAVRQLIGLGPPNTGSALAELFNDPDRGAEIINRLTGVFVPKGFNPATDQLVQDVRPGSPVMHSLRTAGLRTDIIYRIIVTTNPGDEPGFFPLFEGKTWEIGDDGKYCPTLEGDGVVAHRESVLPGISLDVLSASPGGEGQLPGPDQYCHINLPRNPEVIGRIMQYPERYSGKNLNRWTEPKNNSDHIFIFEGIGDRDLAPSDGHFFLHRSAEEYFKIGIH